VPFPPSSRRPLVVAESLEPRRLFASAGLKVELSSDTATLTVGGTNRRDQVVISVDPADPTRLLLTRNAARYTDRTLRRADITRIRIDGRGGNDRIRVDDANGVVGAARLRGGSGRDILVGGAGNDTLDGGSGRDDLSGGDGNDALTGGSGGDTLDGGAGDDLLVGSAGGDYLAGQAGNDTLIGQAGKDTLIGGLGDDQLQGDDGRDRLDGGEGRDAITGGADTDTVRGGPGADVFLGTYFKGEIKDRQSEDRVVRPLREPDKDDDSSFWDDLLDSVGDFFGGFF